MQEKEVVSNIRKQHPVVQCITNMVTVNDCANCLLAVGASPTMAHAIEEVAEVTAGTQALVLNLGATEYAQSMLLAGETAHQLQHPIVFDPVGVAASTYRRNLAYEILEKAHPTCVRGNYSEIYAIYKNQNTAAGVDECQSEDVNLESQIETIVTSVAKQYECIVIASGAIDIISDGMRLLRMEGGSKMMKMITGAGCMSSALLGAFLSMDEDAYAMACACMKMIGQCAKAAEEKQIKLGGGSMTFHDALIDEISLY